MTYPRIRYFRLHLYLAACLSVSSLIAQGAPALAETPQPAAVGTERVMNADVTPDNQTALTLAPEDQVTSVSQLADVQPTDWAFQALQSLIERYGVVAGYPDGTFRGNRALTRYEFAAGLKAVLEQVDQLIATGLADKIARDDLAVLQRLQEEFAAELATLQGRVDSLEARTAELEANQFSITTKLTGQAIVAVSGGGFSGERIVDPTGAEIANEEPNATVIYRAGFDLITSFTGTDKLNVRFDTGSALDRDNAAGFLEPNFGSVLEYSIRHTPNDDFGLIRANYTFTPFQDVIMSVGPLIVVTDYVDKNTYAAGILDFSTLALVNNYILFPIIAPVAGAAIDWNPGEGPITVRAVYAAGDAANASPNNQTFVGSISPFTRLLFPGGVGGNRGLFGDPNQGIFELEYAPSRAFALRLQYSLGTVFDGRFDVFGANFELALSQQLAVFGRYGYGSYNDTALGDINPNYWMAGVSFRDLFVPGALAGVAAGQPFIDNAVGNATQTNIEAYYNFPVNDNIRVTPFVQVILDPANQDSNGTIVTGSLRTVFSF